MSRRISNYCSIPECPNRLRPLYRFPNLKRQHMFDQWVKATKIPRFRGLTPRQIYGRGYICKIHFKPDDFVIHSKRKKLLPTAVPSLNLGPERCFEEFPFTTDESANQIDLPLETDVNHQLIDNCDFFLNPKSHNVGTIDLAPQPFLYLPSKNNGDANEMEVVYKNTYVEIDNANSLLKRLLDKNVTKDNIQDEPTQTYEANIDYNIQEENYETLSNLINGKFATEEVCRICLCSIEPDGLFSRQTEHIANMIKLVLPDLDLTMYSNNVYCQRCVELLTYSYQLRETWLVAEEKLQKLIKERKEIVQDKAPVVEEEKRREIGDELDAFAFDHCYNKPFDRGIPFPSTTNNLFGVTVDPQHFQEIGKKKEIEIVSGPYQCDKCGRTFMKMKTFEKHQYNHNRPRIRRKRPKAKKRQCMICLREIIGITRFIKHVQKHLEVKQKTVHICTTCSKTFATKHSLNMHIKRRHLRQYEYVQCHLCGKTLTSAGSLRHHMLVHSGQKKHECNVCQKKFIYAANLRRHQRSHDKAKSLSCEYCGKLIKYEKSLVRHIRVFHTDGGDNVCEFCNKPYTNVWNLKQHRIREHGWSVNSQTTEVSNDGIGGESPES